VSRRTGNYAHDILADGGPTRLDGFDDRIG
jgi:hypothetical protein